MRKDAGIETPADLKGKQIWVPEYQQTAALWTRGVLEIEFGVKPSDMTFWMERHPDHSHAHATGFEHPPGVTINQIPHDKNFGSMMISGELHGVVHYIVNANMVDRSTADLSNHPDIKPLFPDPPRRGYPLLSKDRYLSHQPWHQGQPPYLENVGGVFLAARTDPTPDRIAGNCCRKYAGSVSQRSAANPIP